MKIMSPPCLFVHICASDNKPMLAVAYTEQQCGGGHEGQPGHCAAGSHNLGRQIGPPKSRRPYSMEADCLASLLTCSVTLSKLADLCVPQVLHLQNGDRGGPCSLV